MKLSTSQVQQIANLVRLKLTPAEEEKFRKELSSVLAYAEKLNKVDTKRVKPISQITGLENICQEDKVKNCQPEIIEDLLASAPAREGNLIKVRRVF